MEEHHLIFDVLVLTFLSGSAAALGALLAREERVFRNWLQYELRHGIIAFGGGALLAAVALVLLPRGMELQPSWLGILTFTGGAALFMMADRYFVSHGSNFSQLMAMMLDFVPEAIVLGALITKNYAEAVFMAAIIAAQNFPEGFNAFREMVHESRGMPPGRAFRIISICAASGLVWGMAGYLLFAPASIELGILMTLCAGGIFYLVFRDIAPQAKLEYHWFPSFGAVLGFVFGVAGHELVKTIT